MPWKETCAVSERHHLVKLVREGISVSEAARTLGISRKTAYKWLSRHDRWGVEGFSGRSRARDAVGAVCAGFGAAGGQRRAGRSSAPFSAFTSLIGSGLRSSSGRSGGKSSGTRWIMGPGDHAHSLSQDEFAWY